MACEIENEQMLGSCMSYSRLGKLIEDAFGVPMQRFYGRSHRAEEVMSQIRIAVREEARRAAEEAVLRALRAAADNLPVNPEDGLYVPSVEIVINSGKVGRIRTHPFNSQRNGR